MIELSFVETQGDIPSHQVGDVVYVAEQFYYIYGVKTTVIDDNNNGFDYYLCEWTPRRYPDYIHGYLHNTAGLAFGFTLPDDIAAKIKGMEHSFYNPTITNALERFFKFDSETMALTPLQVI